MRASIERGAQEHIKVAVRGIRPNHMEGSVPGCGQVGSDGWESSIKTCRADIVQSIDEDVRSETQSSVCRSGEIYSGSKCNYIHGAIGSNRKIGSKSSEDGL